MIVSVPQKLFNVCRAIEEAAGKQTLGILFDQKMWCWTIVDEQGVIYAKLSTELFPAPPEVRA